MGSEPADQYATQALADVTEVIFAVSDDIPPGQRIDPEATLVGDLGLESIQIANIFFRLNTRYAGAVSLAEFLTGIADAGWQADASVGNLVDFIAAALRQKPAAEQVTPQ